MIACSHGYKIEDDKVFYEYWNEGSGQNKMLLKEADAKSFRSLDFNYSLKFGKDKNHLYINGQQIKNIDPHSFEFIGNYIFRDKDSAYFFGFYNNLNECVITGVNPNELELIEYPWARCKNILIHGKDTLALNDINDFTPITNDWGKTNQYVINRSLIILGADTKTFEVINSYSGKDRDYQFKFGFISKDELDKKDYFKTDFDKIDLCKINPTIFIDSKEELVTYDPSQSKHLKIVDKLKSFGFSVENIRHRNYGESKITSVILKNDQCSCFVDKRFQYDYSRTSELESFYQVSETIFCRQLD